MISRVPETTSSEFEQAVEAAKEAFKTWSRTSVLTRQRFALEYVSPLPPPCPTYRPHHYVSRLQAQIRQNADALADSIVLEQGKTFAGESPPCTRLPFSSFTRSHADAHGDVLRGLQVVETACNIPTALMGDKIEVTKDMDTETRRLPLGVCARSVSLVPIRSRIEVDGSIASLRSISLRKSRIYHSHFCF